MMLFRKTLIFLILIFTTCNDPVTNKPFELDNTSVYLVADSLSVSKKADWIDSIFQRLSKHNWFNGAIVYGEKGHLIYANAFGFENFRTKDTLTVNSAFQLASVSKMFTAMSVMILQERKLLDYEDTIQQYIPDFPYNGISIRNLLNHRSGLSRYMSLAHEKWKNKTIPLTNDSMLELIHRNKPNPYFKPDAGFHYCNTNYAVLASIVENASGMPFEQFVEEEIFEPLHMDDSFIYSMRDDSSVSFYVEDGVTGHRNTRWRSIRVRNEYLNGVSGDKGVYCSIEDIFKFDLSLNNFTLVRKETLQEAFTPGSPKFWRRKNNYGFGWRISTHSDSTVFHFGWWKGFRAYYIRDMKQEKTIIALSNKDKGPGSSILQNIIRDTTHKILFYTQQDSIK